MSKKPQTESSAQMRANILSTAMQLANLKGWKNVTRDDIADRANIAAGSVSYHFGDMRKLQTAMMVRAVESENLKIVAQGLAAKHPAATKAPDALKRRALLSLAG